MEGYLSVMRYIDRSKDQDEYSTTTALINDGLVAGRKNLYMGSKNRLCV